MPKVTQAVSGGARVLTQAFSHGAMTHFALQPDDDSDEAEGHDYVPSQGTAHQFAKLLHTSSTAQPRGDSEITTPFYRGENEDWRRVVTCSRSLSK